MFLVIQQCLPLYQDEMKLLVHSHLNWFSAAAIVALTGMSGFNNMSTDDRADKFSELCGKERIVSFAFLKLLLTDPPGSVSYLE